VTDSLGAGLIGFLVVLALAIAAVFLFRSMLKHLRRVPPTFDPPPDQSDVTLPPP
jgi:O-antigen ligase